MHIELTNGQTAEFRDAETITRKERNDLLRGLDGSGKLTIEDGKLAAADSSSFDDAIAATDAFTAFLVTAWTLSEPLPSDDATVLDRLCAVDAAKLEQATADVIAVLMPDAKSDPTRPPT